MKRNDWARKLAFWMHLWLGVFAGMPLAVIGVTGSALVFGSELERAVYPQFLLSPDARPNEQPMSWAEFGAVLNSQIPPEKIGWIHRSPWHFDSFLVGKKGTETIAPFDAWSGKFLGTYVYEGTFLDWLYKIHVELVAGETGVWVAGVTGLFLVWLAFTGVCLWWPRHLKNLKSALSIGWKRGWKRRNWDLHVVGGTVCALLLAILGYTGAMFNLPVVEEKTKAVLVREKSPERKSKWREGDAIIGLREVERAATRQFPGAILVAVNFPHETGDSFNLLLKQAGEPYRYGETELNLDPKSGAVLKVQNGLQSGGEDAVHLWQQRLHFGHFAGLPTRILYVFLGLVPAFLWVSGMVMWWNRAGAPRWRKKTRQTRKNKDVSAETPLTT